MKTRNAAGRAYSSRSHSYLARPICPWSRSGSVESRATMWTSPMESECHRGPNSSSKWT